MPSHERYTMKNNTLKRIFLIYLGAFLLFYFVAEGKTQASTKTTKQKKVKTGSPEAIAIIKG